MTSTDTAAGRAAPPRPVRSRLAATFPAGLPVLGPGVRRVLSRMFGPPPFDPAGDPGDPGLLGPESASWQVIGEPAAIAGGLRGLLLQVAHPLAMAGVADHSAFREDPLGRLQRTSGYVTATTFGSTREALAISRVVRDVHPYVRGTAPDGRAYRAEDPELLAWVSIALTSSFLAADAAWAPDPVRGRRANAFVAEQSRIAALLDPRVDLDVFEQDPSAQAALRADDVDLPLVDEGWLPTDVASLDERLAAYRADLGINHQGRDALRFLRRPPIPRSARAGYRALFGGAIASLQGPEAEALELRLRPARAKALSLRAGTALSAMRFTTGISPSRRLAEQRATRGTLAD